MIAPLGHILLQVQRLVLLVRVVNFSRVQANQNVLMFQMALNQLYRAHTRAVVQTQKRSVLLVSTAQVVLSALIAPLGHILLQRLRRAMIAPLGHILLQVQRLVLLVRVVNFSRVQAKQNVLLFQMALNQLYRAHTRAVVQTQKRSVLLVSTAQVVMSALIAPQGRMLLLQRLRRAMTYRQDLKVLLQEKLL
jgi:hypothetical protein